MLSYKLPYFLKVESGIMNSTIDILKENNIDLSKTIIITDSIIYRLYANKIYEKLIENYSVELKIINSNSILEAVNIANFIINEDVTAIIGIGGGRPLDVSKYAASMTKRNFISIPTTIANDGVASPVAVLQDSNGKTKSLGCSVPSGIILDIDIIRNGPEELIKAGIGDTLSNLTAIYDWELDNKENKGVINDFSKLLSSISVHSLINSNNNDIKSDSFLKLLSESIILSGMAMEIDGSSRPCSGSEHLFSHALDQIDYGRKNLHGIQVALGSIISAYLQKQDYKMFIKFLQQYSVNVNPINLGINRETFIKAFNNAKSTRPNRYTILNKINLNNEEISNLYDILCVEV
jgi:glycerol-1-phosphate dehydrogenase [NAD(P)+]